MTIASLVISKATEQCYKFWEAMLKATCKLYIHLFNLRASEQITVYLKVDVHKMCIFFLIYGSFVHTLLYVHKLLIS